MGNKNFARLFLCLAAFSLALSCSAQVLSVSRIKDPQGRVLQQKYTAELGKLGADAAAVHFPYPFYFSETLDIDEVRQKQLPMGSIHFDNFNGQIVLQITGNYYASYSATVLGANLRARKTFQDVILPLLKVVVAHVDRTVPLDAYAFEIAHHVRGKTALECDAIALAPFRCRHGRIPASKTAAPNTEHSLSQLKGGVANKS